MLVGKEPLRSTEGSLLARMRPSDMSALTGCFRGKSGPDVLDMGSSRLTPQPIEALLPIVVYAPALDVFL
jgi:hypothetical protein